ncbi:MAG TPA: glycosyltransferase family 4 protein [Fimbriiglobus sp.]|jgi:glycosyltransferase involved in cell wall biosynthesis
MRILYVSQYFPPEMGAPAARVYELSREWVRRGHRVTVLTAFPHHPTGVKRPGDRGVLTRRETVDGIDVVRTYVYAAANKGTAKRMASYGSFLASAAIIGPWRVDRPDVVIATSPQLLCGVAGYVLARFLRVPFVFEVRDLWPESILAVEALKEGTFIRALKRVARFLYTHCSRIVTVGDGYRRGIESRYGIPERRIDVVRNGIDTSLFVPLPRENEIRAEYGWGNKFVAMYVGTHGMAHGLTSVLEAARAMRDEADVLFVFVGEGAEKDGLKRQAADWQLANVQFIDQQPKARVPLFYAACDVGLVTLRDTPLFQEVLPSKIFEYLGMERPIVLAVGGEARKVVEAAGAGEYVPPGDVPALIAAVRRAAADRPRLTAMGRAGRAYVLTHFDRRALAAEYLNILARVTGSNSTPEN